MYLAWVSHAISAIVREMTIKSSAGFSILELMITLCVLGILMSLAAPSLSRLMVQFEGRVIIHRLHRAIQLARLWSVSRHHSMDLCARDQGNNWSLGWEIVDSETGYVHYADSHLADHWQLVWRGGLQSTSCLRFSQQGFVQGHQGRFTVRGANDAFKQSIVVGRSGYSRLIDG